MMEQHAKLHKKPHIGVSIGPVAKKLGCGLEWVSEFPCSYDRSSIWLTPYLFHILPSKETASCACSQFNANV